jgi:MFS family permease
VAWLDPFYRGPAFDSYIGKLVDEHGSRKILLPSFTVFAVLLALIPILANQLWILFLLFALIGSLAAGANALPYLRTISAWFDRRRALALGVAMGGSGMGYVYVPPAVQYMIDTHGWRSAYFMLATVTLVVAVPLVYFVLREAPSGQDIEGSDELRERSSTPLSASRMPLLPLLRRPLLWWLFIIFCLLSFTLYGVLAEMAATGDRKILTAFWRILRPCSGIVACHRQARPWFSPPWAWLWWRRGWSSVTSWIEFLHPTSLSPVSC